MIKTSKTLSLFLRDVTRVWPLIALVTLAALSDIGWVLLLLSGVNMFLALGAICLFILHSSNAIAYNSTIDPSWGKFDVYIIVSTLLELYIFILFANYGYAALWVVTLYIYLNRK